MSKESDIRPYSNVKSAKLMRAEHKGSAMTATTEDISIILKSVEKFCRDKLPPDEVRRRDEGHVPPYDLLQTMGEMGLIRLAVPESAGGLGLPWSVLCRVQERLAETAYFAASILNRAISFGVKPLVMFGSDKQKQELIPRILDGRLLIALALTEPGVGSDARAVQSRAERSGNGWKIVGRKSWCSDAGGAGFMLALCRTPKEGERSLTAFLIPTDARGVSMTPLAKVGNNCMPSFDVGLDDVYVEDDSRLGDVGKGFKTVTGTLAYSRSCMSATAVGCAQSAVDLAIAYAKERVQFGQPIAQFQVIKHRLVDMAMEVKKARLLVYELAKAIEEDGDLGPLPAMAKIAATEALQFVTNHGMQILASGSNLTLGAHV